MKYHHEVSYWELIKNGIISENIIFRLALSLCPALAVTSKVKYGLLMGIAVLFVHTMVGITVSLIRRFIHQRIRLPIIMLVIATWVTVTDLMMAAYAREAYAVMGLYIQLIVAFASILARAEMFGSKNPVMPSMFDGIGMGLGFLIALVTISFFRELLGSGSVFGFQIVDTRPVFIMMLPTGGFFAVGILMACFNWIDRKYSKKKSSSH
ncbi:MAG: electron transport complex subunit RsxE [Thermodesulfovibrionia bacterium]|nr:electron transport complex subunit RsxE [Thermodesulfovibrionia bacterium]